MPRVPLDGLFAGQVVEFAGDGRRSAIAKAKLGGRCRLTALGLAGDAQADRRVHGGPAKALHHLPAEHYARLAEVFPAARHLAPGGLGENLSTHRLTEHDVCIGDAFRLGGARIQVSQPRTPCWKIDHRAGCAGVSAYIAEHGIAGWYYRVLEAGNVAAGDWLECIERPGDGVTLAQFWRVVRDPRPPIEALLRVAHASGLDAQWAARLTERADWLRRNARGGAA